MTIILSYCHRDYSAAFTMARLLARKTDLRGHRFMFYASMHAPLPSKEPEDGPWGFGCPVDVLQCDGDPYGYPAGPNYQFAGLAKTVLGGKFPGDEERICLIESDSFPTRGDWADVLVDAHLATGKRVSGSLVDWIDPVHINGSLVIDRSMIEDYPVLGRPVIEAWDVHHAELLLSEGADNPEIMLARKEETYMPTDWWWGLEKEGKQPAWVHGIRGFAMLDRLEREGFAKEVGELEPMPTNAQDEECKYGGGHDWWVDSTGNYYCAKCRISKETQQ